MYWSVKVSKLLTLAILGLVIVSLAAVAFGCAPTAATSTPAPTATKAPATAPTTPAATPTTPAASTATPTQRPREKVTLRLDFLAFGYQAPFFWALEKGYYRDRNLDVTILDGQGSATTIKLIGSGENTFGFADVPTMIQNVAAGVPVKAVATLWPTSTNAVLYRTETGIKTPKDLEGKKLGFAPGSAQETLWPAFVAANNLDEKKITVVTTDIPSKLRLLNTKQVDFLVTQCTAKWRGIRIQEVGEDCLLFADYGLRMVGYALMTQPDTIKNKPQMVKDFVAATVRAFKEFKDKPDLGKEMEDIQKKNRPDPDLPMAAALDELKESIPLLESPDTKGKPYGTSSEKEWQATLDVLVKYANLPRTPALTELFTNEFIQ